MHSRVFHDCQSSAVDRIMSEHLKLNLVELNASVIVHEELVSVRVAAERSHSRDNSGSATAASPPSVCRSLDQTPRSDQRQRKTRSDRRRHKPSRHTRSVRSPPETHTHGSIYCHMHCHKCVSQTPVHPVTLVLLAL